MARRAAAPGKEAEPVRNATDLVAMPDIRKGDELFRWLTGGLSSAGTTVTELTAMRVSAVYASLNLIGGAIANLPLPDVKRTRRPRTRRGTTSGGCSTNNHPPGPPPPSGNTCPPASCLTERLRPYPARLAHVAENRWLRAAAQTARRHLPLSDGRLGYRYTPPGSDKFIDIDQDDMLHIPGPGFDGLSGMSQIRHALHQPGRHRARGRRILRRLLQNGARPDFAIGVPGVVTPSNGTCCAAPVRPPRRHRQCHLPALMVGGAKFTELTMNAEDAQLIDAPLPGQKTSRGSSVCRRT